MARNTLVQQWLSMSHDVVATCDSQGIVTRWNAAAERLHNISAANAIGQPIAEVQRWLAPTTFDDIRAALEQDETWKREIRQVLDNGSEISADVQAQKFVEGEEEGFLIISRDLTAIREDDDAKLRSQRMDTLGNLVAGISHDLKNVLTPILLAASLLEVSLEDEDDREILETLRRSANRGVNMVQQLLWFYKGGAERSLLDPRDIIRELRQMMKESFPKSIDVRVMTPPELASVTGNPTQIYQMLLNLCVNARDAMPDGGRLTVRLDDVPEGRGESTAPLVRFSVEDEGCGIPEEDQKRVFELLYTTKSTDGGSGVGLATVAHIAEDHGGTVELHSVVGEGTRFEIYLPAESDAPTRLTETHRQPVRTSGNGRTILIVEDEPALRMMTEEALQLHGFKTVTAIHGQEAAEIFRERSQEIDLVVTDLNMPVMDGRATIAAMREIAPDVQLLAVSALPLEVRGRQIDETIPFLSKPYELHELLNSIEAVLKS